MNLRKAFAVIWLTGALVFTLGFAGPVLAECVRAVPPPWQSRDIGDAGTAGSSCQGPDGDLFLAGAGADIWNTADSFHFLFQPLGGDGDITAHLSGEENTDPFAKTGVMIRQSEDPGSPDVILDVKPDGGVEFMTRSAQGAETTFIAGGSVRVIEFPDGRVAMSVYLNLVRSRGVVTASICEQGACRIVGSTPWVSGPALIGAAVTSHDPSRLNHAYFDAGPPMVSTVPRPWQSFDIGPVGQRGDAFFENDTFTVRGAGADIWGTSDSFHFVFQTPRTDGEIVARVVSEDAAQAFAKAGVMMRQSFNVAAPTVILDVRPDGEIEFMARPGEGEDMMLIAGGFMALPAWLKLVRSQDTFTAFISGDGSDWQLVGSTDVPLSPSQFEYFAGLAVTSHDSEVLSTSVFDNVSISTPEP